MKPKYISEPNNAGIIDDPIREITDEQRFATTRMPQEMKTFRKRTLKLHLGVAQLIQDGKNT